MHNETIRYFPFAEGVPYHILNGRYIIPKMDAQNWHRIFENKTPVLCLNGGFIENLFALSYFEVLNYFYPGKKLEWCGNPVYKKMNELQGLATSTNRISYEDLVGYPVPMFFNKNKTAVFMNCLNNYCNVYTYQEELKYKDSRAIFRQIFRNIMVNWDVKYLPKLRNLNIPEKLANMAKISHFNLDAPYVLLMPDITGWSDHNVTCLDWTLQDVRSFAAMLSNTGLNLIILTNVPQKYYGMKAFVATLNLENLLYLLQKSKFLLAKEVDFILSSLLLGNSTAFSLKGSGALKISKNQKYLKCDNEIIITDRFGPIDVYKEVYGRSNINDGYIQPSRIN